MRVLEFQTNPFRNLVPGGSPSDRWSNPPTVFIGGAPYLVVFFWDRPLMEARNGKSFLDSHLLGVTGQAIARACDGSEFYVRTSDTGCILIPTGFRGQPFTPDKTQQPKEEIPAMTVLQSFHEYISEYVYTESTPEEQEGIKADLAECPDIPETKAYLGWPPEYFAQVVESFFTDANNIFNVEWLP